MAPRKKRCTAKPSTSQPDAEPVSENKTVASTWKESFVLQLPDELLLMILTLATSNGVPEGCQQCDCEPNYDSETVKRLSQTCHRFHSIALPLLYRNIHFEYPPTSAVTKCLRHTPPRILPLLKKCRTLSIRIVDDRLFYYNRTRKVFAAVNDLVAQLTDVRCLDLHVETSEYAQYWTSSMSTRNSLLWAFIQHIFQSIPGIKHIAITGQLGRTILSSFMKLLDNLPSPRKLDIIGKAQILDNPQDLKIQRTSEITSLSLSQYDGGRIMLEHLLERPKKLSHLSLTECNSRIEELGSHTLRAMLLTHKETLSSLTVGWGLTSGPRGLIKVSDFPNLEFLRISRNSLPDHLVFSREQADLLLSPKLKTFGLFFRSWMLPPAPFMGVVNWEEECWLIALAEEARRRESSLREFEIMLSSWYWDMRGQDRLSYLGRIRHRIAQYGIKVTFALSNIT